MPFKRNIGETGIIKLNMNCKIYNGVELIFHKENIQGSPFWGDNFGYSYFQYEVPYILPRSIPLQVEILLIGNITEFLFENKGAQLVIEKFSDE